MIRFETIGARKIPTDLPTGCRRCAELVGEVERLKRLLDATRAVNSVNKGDVNKPPVNKDRKAYMREYMKRKRGRKASSGPSPIAAQ